MIFRVIISLIIINYSILADVPRKNKAKIHRSYQEFYNYGLESEDEVFYDPFEKVNRRIFRFNQNLDSVFFSPLTKVYIKVTNKESRMIVSNFIANLTMPLTLANNILQGKFDNALCSFWHFAINTTFGIGGCFDIASKFGLKVKPQTFADTLAYYSFKSGPYIVLPFFGSFTLRGLLSFGTEYCYSLSFRQSQRYVLFNLYFVEKRASMLGLSDLIMKASVDPYTLVRSVIGQKELKRAN